MSELGWVDCELRTYESTDASGFDTEASPREMKASWQHHPGADVPLTTNEQLQLRAASGRAVDADTEMVTRELKAIEIAAAAASTGRVSKSAQADKVISKTLRKHCV
ncbi:hypothetical protein MN608_08475 [Microdochium nivale]|nr:hypothetical protein MN608_08475 [Microdochium nivale]